MRTLVTGSSGFVGRALVPELVRRGHEVGALVRHRAAPEGVATFSADLLDEASLRAAVTAFRPECVVHLGAIALVTTNDQLALYQTNTIGTERLLRVLAEVTPKGTPVLLASTGGVYGNQSVEVLSEDLTPRPANHYGTSKLAMEHLARQLAGPLKLRVVRLFNVIGPGQSEEFLVPKLVRHFAEKKESISLGNIEPYRDYVDMRDAVRMLASLIELPPGDDYDIVNLCTGAGTSVRQMLTTLEKLTGHRPRVDVDPRLVRPNEVWKMVGSDRKLQKLLGPQRHHTLEQTLAWLLSARGG